VKFPYPQKELPLTLRQRVETPALVEVPVRDHYVNVAFLRIRDPNVWILAAASVFPKDVVLLGLIC
jgi:hypothetical protein